MYARAFPGFFIGDTTERAEGRERGWGSWGGGSNPSPPARGVGNRCELPQWSLGTPDPQRLSTIFSTQDLLTL